MLRLVSIRDVHHCISEAESLTGFISHSFVAKVSHVLLPCFISCFASIGREVFCKWRICWLEYLLTIRIHFSGIHKPSPCDCRNSVVRSVAYKVVERELCLVLHV